MGIWDPRVPASSTATIAPESHYNIVDGKEVVVPVGAVAGALVGAYALTAIVGTAIYFRKRAKLKEEPGTRRESCEGLLDSEPEVRSVEVVRVVEKQKDVEIKSDADDVVVVGEDNTKPLADATKMPG